MRRTRLSLRRCERSECRSGDSRVRAVVGSCRAGEVVVEGLGGGAPAERLARPAVERGGDRGEVLGAVSGEVGASGEVLAKQPVGVLVGASLPRALRIAEVDLQAGLDPQLWRAGPSRRPGPRSATGAAAPGSVVIAAAIASRTASAPCPVTGGPFLTRRLAVLGRREVQQHREAGRALHQRADRGAVSPEDQIALPVTRDGPVLGLGGPLADHDLLADEVLAALRASPRDAQRPPGPQARDELSLAALRGPGRRAPGRSPRGRSASTHHRGSRAAAGGRSAPGSTRSPTCGPGGAACSDPSTAWSPVPAPRSRPAGEPDRTAAPARTRAAARRRRASRSSDAGPSAPPSTARPTRDTRASRREWPRCGAAPWRSSTAIARPAGRSPARRHPALCSSAISSRSANDK